MDDDTYKPNIIILKEGNGVEKDPVYANIEVSADLLTFNGTPGGPKTLTVTSDHDFTVSTSASWLSLDVTEGLAGEATDIQVTCEESQLSELRQGTIKIVSEDSELVVNVVQSAAGQILDPFVSVSGGNKAEVFETEGSLKVKIQSNVEVSYETADAWIQVEPAPETKALVEWTEYVVSYQANELTEPRTGTVRFFNEEEKVETIFTLVQAGKEPEPEYPEGIYFQDDFEWLAEWSAAAPDDVTNNSVGSSQNMFTTEALAPALAEFQHRGYGYVWGWKGQDWSDGTPDSGNKQTLYLMKNYLKFGKTSYNSGIILPALKNITGTADVELTFDWCWCMTGASKPDIMTLTVTVSGGGTLAATGTEVSEDIVSAQPTEGDLTQLEWQHAKVLIQGATPETRITIRPTNNDPSVTSTRKQNRWYLDNIKVAEPEPAKPAVGDVLWEEWWQGGAANQKASEYSASEARTTVAFDNAAVNYTEGGATALKADGLVFCDKVANITDEKQRVNLLVGKGNGYLEATGIPCNGVKTATLTYRSNSKLEGNHQVTSSTSGVTIGELSATSVPKLDLDSKYTYTVTCTVTIPEGVKTLDLRITNINASANIRVDGLQLVVTEVQ